MRGCDGEAGESHAIHAGACKKAIEPTGRGLDPQLTAAKMFIPTLKLSLQDDNPCGAPNRLALSAFQVSAAAGGVIFHMVSHRDIVFPKKGL